MNIPPPGIDDETVDDHFNARSPHLDLDSSLPFHRAVGGGRWLNHRAVNERVADGKVGGVASDNRHGLVDHDETSV